MPSYQQRVISSDTGMIVNVWHAVNRSRTKSNALGTLVWDFSNLESKYTNCLPCPTVAQYDSLAALWVVFLLSPAHKAVAWICGNEYVIHCHPKDFIGKDLKPKQDISRGVGSSLRLPSADVSDRPKRDDETLRSKARQHRLEGTSLGV